MPNKTHKSRFSRAVRDEGRCSIRPMTVHVRKHLNFKDVLFPREFDSFRCGGRCEFPLDTSVGSLLIYLNFSFEKLVLTSCVSRFLKTFLGGELKCSNRQ